MGWRLANAEYWQASPASHAWPSSTTQGRLLLSGRVGSGRPGTRQCSWEALNHLIRHCEAASRLAHPNRSGTPNVEIIRGALDGTTPLVYRKLFKRPSTDSEWVLTSADSILMLDILDRAMSQVWSRHLEGL